ncbi:2-haloacid dehalogenase [Mumia flava]|uniref:2-haloacid dehalogenase n=1 Tax=Mumia flava TaxID=1348852 RepID=A0A0B2BP69_9ACTN|nr:haloacid dehalogenase type II [Mumia flava]PJJ58378.1 2-haloacid dehalogenase [Mumia flava]
MVALRDVVDVVVFDVLGTLVDEPSGLRAAIAEAVPAADDAALGELVGLWQTVVEDQQLRIAAGDRAYAPSDVVDAEAAEAVAARAGLGDVEVVARLAAAGRRLPAWPDADGGLERLARRYPLVGLSNASRASLLRLDAAAGLRWHLALSSEDAGAYKPAPEVYGLALSAAAVPAERVLMVAAHAWDLRGARAVGMRTAYVERPVGDPPRTDDGFDLEVGGLDALADALGA